MRAWLRRFLRRPFATVKATVSPPPRDWTPLAREKLPWLAALDDDERARALAHLNAIANGVVFVGEGGLEVTDDMVVVIAGAAARLSRNLPLSVYRHLKRVVVVPEHLEMHDGSGYIFGLASSTGVVTLSWKAVTHGVTNPFDGHDTALHEFAHILDFADGAFDGVPPAVDDDHAHHAWSRALATGFVHFQEKADKGLGRRSVLRDYGATNAAEFFAVATEAFFEKPRQLKKKKPEVYRALVRFYRIDPLRKRREPTRSSS